ncbi:MAG: dipicolinate synthase subunit B [Oscillospiraceae bacterium]|nr:dipicolinate synthase subunit B [Oscillospiraceae bacterium]
MEKPKLGLALCGSFCTFEALFRVLPSLTETFEVIPIMSETAAGTDTRFGRAEDIKNRLRDLCGREPITTVTGAEPIGPRGMLDVLAVAPCTGNTLGKLARGINDTAVTMAVKSHLRGGRPVVIAISTNDGLGACAKNLGLLLERRHFYFVPFRQDDPEKKPLSLVSDLEKLQETALLALAGKQIQPILA